MHAGASVRHVFLESLAARIAGALAPGAGVYVDQWISTPDGEQLVDVVIRSGERSIGLVVGHRYEQDAETLDALRLVYGGFDVLYRLTNVDASRSVDDALYALVCEKPSWFTAAGRVGAVRRASAPAAVRAAVDAPGRVAIRRMRLSRANEWVAAFERALGAPALGAPALGAPAPGSPAPGSPAQPAGHSAGHQE